MERFNLDPTRTPDTSSGLQWCRSQMERFNGAGTTIRAARRTGFNGAALRWSGSTPLPNGFPASCWRSTGLEQQSAQLDALASMVPLSDGAVQQCDTEETPGVWVASMVPLSDGAVQPCGR